MALVSFSSVIFVNLFLLTNNCFISYILCYLFIKIAVGFVIFIKMCTFETNNNKDKRQMSEEQDLLKDENKESVRRPYNLRDTSMKTAAYRGMIRAELADELYDKIMNIVVMQKKYKDPNYSARDLAKELQTNTRYLSAVINSRFGMNYSCLVNEYRIKDALHLLVDKRYVERNIEEISAMVGFANRQSFYAAFYKNMGETPNGYRKRKIGK